MINEIESTEYNSIGLEDVGDGIEAEIRMWCRTIGRVGGEGKPACITSDNPSTASKRAIYWVKS